MNKNLISTPVESVTMTLAELATCLHIGKTKAYDLARHNQLPVPTLKVGREFRFSRPALQRWLESGGTQDAR